MTDAQTQRIFEALADPTRRALLRHLCEEGSGTTTKLAARFPMSRQAVTKHLQTLAEAGLVTFQERGRERQWEPHPESLQAATSWIAEIEARWDQRLTALRRYLMQDQPEDSSGD